MKTIKKLCALALVLLLSASVSFAEGIKFEHGTLDAAIAKAKKENKPIFIDIYATWCGPCKMLTNSTFKDQELGAYMNEHFINLKLDGELDDGASLMWEFDLNSYPSMIFITPEKKLLRKVVGYVEPDEIMTAANKALNPQDVKYYALEKRYNEGERGKDFLKELVNEGIEEDMDVLEFGQEYLKYYPELDLEDRTEFIIFGLGSDELDDKHVKEFVANPMKYSELHENLVVWKVDMLLMNIISKGKEHFDQEKLEEDVSTIYAAYLAAYGDEAFAEDQLVDAVSEAVLE